LEDLPHPENQRKSRYECTAVVIQVLSETDETVSNTVNAIHVLHATNFGNTSKESRKQSQKHRRASSLFLNKHLHLLEA
jgi:hypothetical protein